MNNKNQNFKQLFISFALKHQKIINAIFLIFLMIYLFFQISWLDLYEYIIGIPSSILEVLIAIKDFIMIFSIKFYNDLITFPTNLKIISVGILKRFLFEDIIFPMFTKFYVNIVKEDMILYYKLRYREFKKFPMILRTAISSPFAVTIISIVSYFKVLSFLFFGIKKIFTNTIFSKMKFIFIKWIPAFWIIIIDLPIISIIIDYFALVKIISWLKNINIFGIKMVIQFFAKYFKYLDTKIIVIQKYFHSNIGMFLKNKAIQKKYKLRIKIDKILADNTDDYHVKFKTYDNKSFKEKLKRLKNIKKINKNKKILKRKLFIKKIKFRIKKMFTK